MASEPGAGEIEKQLPKERIRLRMKPISQVPALRAENLDLKRQVSRDTLTQLSSRQEITHRLDEITRNNSDATLLIMDVDHFKSINDTFGHLGGDRVMEIIGSRLSSHISEEKGDAAGRWGGDEIAVILNGKIDPEIVAKRAEELRLLFEGKPISYGDKQVGVTFSIGTASRNPGEGLNQWFDRADAAAYKAKENGRNRTVMAESTNV